jgi:hypothetical protein
MHIGMRGTRLDIGKILEIGQLWVASNDIFGFFGLFPL